MHAQDQHRLTILRELRRVPVLKTEAIDTAHALDRCSVKDIEQIRWELAELDIKVTPSMLLAMALSRSVVRTVGAWYGIKSRARKVPVHVTSTGDKQSP